MRKKIDLINKVFGRLKVVREDINKNKKVHWLCECSCGRIKSISSYALRSGSISSCGCLHKEMVSKLGKANYKKASEANIIHGHSRGKRTRTYRIWCSMKTRATNKNYKQTKDYLGRGILVCDRWKKSFINFLEDMGECPEGLQIDRKDNNGNYEPKNCHWVTPSENSLNRREKFQSV